MRILTKNNENRDTFGDKLVDDDDDSVSNDDDDDDNRSTSRGYYNTIGNIPTKNCITTISNAIKKNCY